MAPATDQSTGADNLPSVVLNGFDLPAESLARSARSTPYDSDSAGADVRVLGRLFDVSDWAGSEPVVRQWETARRTLPRAGDEVMGYRLVQELGRGAFGRVFLAEEIALAGRLVAVKVSQSPDDESQTLAQLQHTHIVPIYSAHADPAAGLRMVVMPYFGGTTLDQLLEKAGLRVDPGATGHSLVTALDALARPRRASQCDGSLPQPSQSLASLPQPSLAPSFGASGTSRTRMPSRLLGRAFTGTWQSAEQANGVGQPFRRLLERSSYVQAVTWIAARLAEAVAHAHMRGILHRDLKPSNILLASDGQPMLLDFNLARDVKTAKHGVAAHLGGTLPYMAPEHLDAFNVEHEATEAAVDERSDVYSLGVILFEMFTGKHPFAPPGASDSLPALLLVMAAERRNPPPSLTAINGSLPRSVEAIVQRCLEPDPARRYQQAAHLAEDLQRELDNRPLAHMREPSVLERLKKWVRRHPRLSSGGSIAAAGSLAVTALVILVMVIGGRLAGYDAERRWVAWQQGLVRAQLLIHTGDEADAGSGAGSGTNLSAGQQVCEQTLGLFDVLSRDDWQSGRAARLSDAQRDRLDADAIELMLLLARAHMARAAQVENKERVQRLEESLRILDRAERHSKPHVPRALYADRSECRRALGDAAGAESDAALAVATPAHSAQDHYLLATALAGDRQYDAAVRELTETLRIEPRHFWAHFALAICYDQLGRYGEAVEAYRTCAALWPEQPWTYLNRGLAYSRQGKWAEAIADYGEAIRLDPRFSDAYVNRGVAHLKQNRHDAAIADLSRALELGCDSGAAWAARAAAHAGQSDYDAARADFERALGNNPGDESILLSRGFALARHDPDTALADFDRVLRRDPRQPRAHYGRSLALSERTGREHEAIEAAQQAIAADPDLIAARCGLAVLYARVGDPERAVAEAETALRQQPCGPVCYSAACVYALVSRHKPRHVDRALDLLEKALELGYGWDSLKSDDDLEALRSQPRFIALLAKTH
jgi:serine/threonine protein kinase/Tfp pilus assembly protein PilF